MMINKLLHIYKNLWNLNTNQYPPKITFIIKQIRILVLALRGFIEDKVQLRASALTFYSLLSIVPILAMGFAIAKGFGYEDKLKQQLLDNFENQGEVFHQLIEFADNLLNNTNGGYIAGVGAFVLIWSVMKVMGHIERSFNDIWQIKKARSWFRKFSDYMAMMFISPILFFGSLSYKVYIVNTLETIGFQNWITGFASQLITVFILCVLFSLIYIVMPNAKVNYKNGIIAGVIAGILFSILEYFFINIQISLFSEKYNAIYGAFATVPLFLIWLQYSWLIVLFGAEISFAHQNVEHYEFESESLNISIFYKRILSIFILQKIVSVFYNEEKSLTSQMLAEQLDIPIRLVRDITFGLLNCGLITETPTDSPREMAYLPAVDINKLDIKYVHNKIDSYGFDKIEVENSPILNKIIEIQSAFIDNIEKSSYNTLLKDL